VGNNLLEPFSKNEPKEAQILKSEKLASVVDVDEVIDEP
jgi:hypothetical protein